MARKEYRLSNLPANVQEIITKQYVVADTQDHYDNRHRAVKGAPKVASIMDLLNDDEGYQVEYTTVPVIWEDPTEDAERDGENIERNDFSSIIPRYKKTKTEQKKRSKTKAEVFTPTWVVNKQNNLVDEAIVGKDFFNVENDTDKSWTPTEKLSEFPEDYPWWKYVADRRLEMCCGEGPYLFSRYDAASGVEIPLRDESGRFQRVGLLDRKLRVVSELAESASDWRTAALVALKSTYGFEWQGDNLLLARMNFINTFFDYERDFNRTHDIPKPSQKEHLKTLAEVAEISVWQIWQMDGLKMVIPETCSPDCVACKKKWKNNHDGQLPVIKWGTSLRAFNDFLPEDPVKKPRKR